MNAHSPIFPTRAHKPVREAQLKHGAHDHHKKGERRHHVFHPRSLAYHAHREAKCPPSCSETITVPWSGPRRHPYWACIVAAPGGTLSHRHTHTNEPSSVSLSFKISTETHTYAEKTKPDPSASVEPQRQRYQHPMATHGAPSANPLRRTPSPPCPTWSLVRPPGLQMRRSDGTSS